MAKEEKKAPKLRFNGYTNDWERKKLGDVANSYINGGTPDTQNKNYWIGDIPWIQSSDLKNDDIWNVNINKYITNKAVNDSAAKLIPANSIAIVTRVGVGKLAYMSQEYSTSQDFLSLVDIKEDLIFIMYMLYFKISKLSSSLQGTSIKGITKKELLNLSISIVNNTAEQNRIGRVFKILDNSINLHEDHLQFLHVFKSFLLQKMFFDNDIPPLLRFNKFTEKWNQCRLNDHAIVTMGQSPNSKNYTNNQTDKILVQGNADLYKNKVLKRVFTTEITKTAIKNDILISVRAPVGDIARNQYESVVIGRGIASIKGNDFLYYQLEKMKNSGFWNKYIAGSTFESITGKDLKNAKIYTTNSDEERKIGNIFSSLTNIIQLQEHKIDSLKKLKQFLLQNMFI
ncbi:restriction endonuclease subunit S [Ligilactobacillus salivarius]|uniref:restriction endonuclease subunit S n=1 Tax=Ligilactobacillus salivarius TaxID=1624 RepID=UPI0024B8C3D1|nr:restriction endonuclease subunit S [Ligilactobacillus salivarius]WHS10701.1 restriction endonuclease subunit S [Ligilactobacillus salivarius]